MDFLKKHKEDYFILLESGFIAVNQADEDSAVKLFKAAELLNPTNSLTKIGFGYLHLHKLELKKASQYFQEVLNKEPNNEVAKTFLGIALSWMPAEMQKGEKLLAESAKSSDKLIKKLSNTAIDFVDRCIKKAPAAVETKKKGKYAGKR